MNKKITLCTVHFNTPQLMDALVKSIEMHVPCFHLYIFDNSDKEPYHTDNPNITIFDNTKGQIINFDEWLEKYPQKLKSYGHKNGYISAKHCYTIQKCIELIDKNFILLDSDILLKQDITSLFDERYIYIGESQKQNGVETHRVLPFLCFINIEECKKKNITYFSEQYMHGLHPKNIYDTYDTGAYFYLATRNHLYKEIKLDDYIVHYKGGSWSEMEQKTNGEKITIKEWLNKYKSLWSLPNKKVVYTCITGDYDTLKPITNKDGWDYICFTDKDITSDSWQIKPLPIEVSFLNDIKKQRYIKINPHLFLQEYDLSIWIDGNVFQYDDIDTFLSNIQIDDNIPILFKTHPIRNCIYQELDVCAKRGKETKENTDILQQFYKNEKFPEHYGLFETNIIVRKHNNPKCIKLMEKWTIELLKGSHRDQLSLTYCIWKLNCKDCITEFTPDLFNSYFQLEKHNKTQERTKILPTTFTEDYTTKDDEKNIETETMVYEPTLQTPPKQTPKLRIIKRETGSFKQNSVRKYKIKRC